MTAVPRSSLVGGEFLFGAHHPHCARYTHHLVRLAGHPLCLGCICMGIGIPIGVAAAFLATVQLSGWNWVVLHAGLLAPTAFQPFLQRKPFKMFSRTLAGVFCGSYSVGLGWVAIRPTVNWLFVIGGVLAFVVAWRSLSWLRARFPNDPCRTCPLGTFPTCAWNMDRLLEKSDPLLRAALVEGNIEVIR